MSKTKKQKLRETIKVGDTVWFVQQLYFEPNKTVKWLVHCGIVMRPATKLLTLEILVPYLEDIRCEYIGNCYSSPEALVDASIASYKSKKHFYLNEKYVIRYVYAGDETTVFYEHR